MAIALCFGIMLLNSSVVQAQTASLFTDLTSWEAMVNNSELFETTAGNIAQADEVSSVPGPNAKIGPLLTFQSANTGLTRGFAVESLQAAGSTALEAGFTFNDQEAGYDTTAYVNALSVGDINDFEDDDWSFALLNGAGISAFGVDLRHHRFEAGESISFYSGGLFKYTMDLTPLTSPADSNVNSFVGITTDFVFDKVVFNEDPGSDDIGIANFRMAQTTVVPEPGSVVLFLAGLSTLGLFKWRRSRSK